MKNDENSTAARLKKARIAAGFTSPVDVCEATGWVYSTYAAHENGNRCFVKHGVLYADFFGVSVDWLLTGRGEMSPTNRTLAPTIDLSDFDSWPDQLKTRFVEFIELANDANPDVIKLILDVAITNFRVAEIQREAIVSEPHRQSG